MESKNWLYIALLFTVQKIVLVHPLMENATDTYKTANHSSQLISSTAKRIPYASKVHNKTEEDDLVSCLPITLKSGEYTKFPNNTVYEKSSHTYYNSSFYRLKGDSPVICKPKHENDEENLAEKWRAQFDMAFTYTTQICLGISTVCLGLHLIAFLMVPDMRNQSGCSLASLCISMLLGYGSYLVAHIEGVEYTGIFCICVAAALQFFILAAFLWMSTMGFDVLRSLLKATGKLRPVSRKFSCKRYCIRCVYSWGISLLVIIAIIVLDNVEGISDKYKPRFGTHDICWFHDLEPIMVFFVYPILAIVILNSAMFGFSAYIIFSHRMRMKGDEVQRSKLKRNFLVHSRLAVIMGIAWMTTIFAMVFDTLWLYYIHILINMLQGFFIFLAFTCTKKVKKQIMAKLNFLKLKMPPSNSTPSFKSYWKTGISHDAGLNIHSEVNIV